MLTTTIPANPPLLSPVLAVSDLDTTRVEESAALRYSKIPFTSLFAEGRLRQERTGQFMEQIGDASLAFAPEFALDTRLTSRLYDWRAGFNTSPWSWASFSAHYRRYASESRYDNFTDNQPIGFPGIGYPGFIRARDLTTDEIETRLVLRPVNWFKTSIAYKLLNTDYRTETDPAAFGPAPVFSPGGSLPAGKSDLYIYSLNATLTPWQRLFLSGTVSFQRSSTVTANNGSPAVEPYRGDTWSALGSATYVLSQSTDLVFNYSLSQADFSQGNFATGLPLGIHYQQQALSAGLTRRIGKSILARLQYGFFDYNEPSSGGANNYHAHSILGVVTWRLP